MKTIIWSESLISVFSDNIQASEHKHLMLHVFYRPNLPIKLIVNDREVFGHGIIVDSNVFHTLPRNDGLIFFACIDTTSTIAQQIRLKHLVDSGYKSLQIHHALPFNFSNSFPKVSEYNHFLEQFLVILGINPFRRQKMDERIQTLVNEINAYEHIESTTGRIAERFYLSESRLSHLFKQETGNSLKSFLLLTKLKKAYQLLSSGYNITQAAIESGFYSASHLADTNRKMMGMNVAKAIKDSRFLEV